MLKKLTNNVLVLSFIIGIAACGGGTSSDRNSSSDSDVLTGDSTNTSSDAGVLTGDSENVGATTTLHDGAEVLTSDLVALGKQIYSDTNLSVPVGQSCASCHSLEVGLGFDDPDDSDPSSLGADDGHFGERNSPTIGYTAYIPTGQIIDANIGGVDRQIQFAGQFWDGRAATLEEQAKLPFLNPIEMANASVGDVINEIGSASYVGDFEALFSVNILDDVDATFNYVADAISAFERSEQFSPFSSTFDQVASGSATYTDAQARGELLFNGKAQCDTCHKSPEDSPQIFSDFTYKNIGVPRNPVLLSNIVNPDFIDKGLGGVSENPLDDGRFRVPSLRNIALTAPYMHNGVFKTLTEVIEFYNTRDTTFTESPEIDRNLFHAGNIGELGLSEGDIQNLVEFLTALSDQ